MEILELTFQLGVFFAIYSFIWFFVDLGFMLLNGGKPRSLVETYFFKGIQYVFLVNVIFLFSCICLFASAKSSNEGDK